VTAGEGVARGGGLLQPADQARERGLAGAVGADDGHELALVDLELEVGEGVGLRPRVAVVQAGDVDKRGVGHTPKLTPAAPGPYAEIVSRDPAATLVARSTQRPPSRTLSRRWASGCSAGPSMTVPLES